MKNQPITVLLTILIYKLTMEEKSLVACGTPLSAHNESVLIIEQFLTDNYLFRRNVLNGKVEFKRIMGSENLIIFSGPSFMTHKLC